MDNCGCAETTGLLKRMRIPCFTQPECKESVELLLCHYRTNGSLLVEFWPCFISVESVTYQRFRNFGVQEKMK